MKDIDLKALTDMFSAGHLFMAVMVVVFAWALLKLLQWLSEFLARRLPRYRMQITGVFPALRVLVWATVIYIVVEKAIQPPQAQLFAMLASIGLAVGLAAQDVIRNLISGVILIFERPFRIGDMVRIGDDYGEIVGIGLRSVRLHTFDDSIVTIPNATVMSQQVSNSNSGAFDELVVMNFTVPASLDVQTLKNLAYESATCSPYVYLKKPVTVLADDVFNRTLLTHVTVKAYVLDVRLERLFASDVLERIKHGLLARGLVTPEMVLSALASPEACGG